MTNPRKLWLFFSIAIALVCCEGRRIRVRPEPQEDETVEYYAAEARDGEDARVVYVSSADQYNGLFGQSTAPARNVQDNYIPQGRVSSSHLKSRGKEPAKAPPVQTIRNYNKVNDDGSFTFGYEAADGSFKEETRGTDCVVRGKYGYVDPDGNKREFTYVSGNPCDPNAPKEEEDDLPEEDSNEPENIPANYPTKPVRPLRPVTPAPKPAVTLFHNTYSQQEDEEPEPEQVLKPHPIQSLPVRPQYITRPQIYQQQINSEEEIASYHHPRGSAHTTPASVVYKQSATPINITPRPVPSVTPRSELPATTYRPQLLQVAVTPRPALLYTKELTQTARPSFISSTPSSIPLSVTRGGIDFESEFQRFQHDNHVSPSPSPISALARTTPKTHKTSAAPPPNSSPVYSSELVYDPVSGLYNTQLYQTLPQTEGEFSLSHRIQPYVHQPQHQLLNIQQLQQQSPLYRALRPQPTQTIYQQQQADLQFQNSAQLFAHQQQQRARAQQASQSRIQLRQSSPPPQPQQFYYIQPSSFQHPQALVQGSPIDAFLRGQNIQF